MTPAQGQANRAGNPSLCDHWIASTLRTLAMLVSNVAAFLQMSRRRSEQQQQQSEQQQRNNNNNSSCTTKEALILRTIAQSAIVDSKEFAAVRVADDLVRWTKSSSGRGLTAIRHAQQQQQHYFLPRAGEAQRARAECRSGSGGGPPSPSRVASRTVPLRIAHAGTPALVSLPRSGEEVRAT